MTPMSTSPAISGITWSASANTYATMDATMSAEAAMVNGRLPILSAALPTHTHSSNVATAGMARYRPVPRESRPMTVDM